MYRPSCRLFIPAIVFILSNCASTPASTDQSIGFPAENSPAQFVTEEFLKSHLHVLAHDTLLGRGTGGKGSRMTADYLYEFYSTRSFSSVGMEVQRQSFALEGVFWDAVEYSIYSVEGDDTLSLLQTSLSYGDHDKLFPVLGGTQFKEAPIVFAGFGINYDEYSGISPDHPDLNDSWIMVFEHNYGSEQIGYSSPNNENGRNEYVQYVTRNSGAYGILFISDQGIDEWEDLAGHMSRQLKRPLSVRKGGYFRGGHSFSGDAISVHPDLAASILGLSHSVQLDSLRKVWTMPDANKNPVVTGYYLRNNPVIEQRGFKEDNILAILPGSDPEFRDEVLILSAHYDHMGLGEPDNKNDIIYNGADDNASGTSVLLQIADAFRNAAEKGYRPSRTILFLHAAAEEWGLIGSRYYVQNPVFPNENIVANVNVDMIGHIDNVYENQEETDYVYVIGAGLISSGLEQLVDQANQNSVNLFLDNTYNNVSHPYGLYRRSDQWAFGEQNIPFVFFFSGLHDNYHVPSDTVDRIEWSLLADRAKLVAEVVWRLAETRERPVADRDIFDRRQ